MRLACMNTGLCDLKGHGSLTSCSGPEPMVRQPFFSSNFEILFDCGFNFLLCASYAITAASLGLFPDIFGASHQPTSIIFVEQLKKRLKVVVLVMHESRVSYMHLATYMCVANYHTDYTLAYNYYIINDNSWEPEEASGNQQMDILIEQSLTWQVILLDFYLDF